MPPVIHEIFEFVFRILAEVIFRLLVEVVFLLPGTVLIRLFTSGQHMNSEAHGCVAVILSLAFWALVTGLGILIYNVFW